MYPSGELETLAQRKTLIRARIAVRRYQCAVAVVDLTRPLAQIDRGIALWNRLSPFFKFVALPGGLLLSRLFGRRAARKLRRKKGRIATLVTILPLIFRGVKMAMAFRSAYGQRPRPTGSPSPATSLVVPRA